MNCESVRNSLSLLLYGELSFDEEERVEQRITEIVRNDTAGVAHQRPREGNRQEEVEAGGQARTHDRSTHQDIAL